MQIAPRPVNNNVHRQAQRNRPLDIRQLKQPDSSRIFPRCICSAFPLGIEAASDVPELGTCVALPLTSSKDWEGQC